MCLATTVAIDRPFCIRYLHHNSIKKKNIENQSNGKQFLGQISDVNFIFYICIRIFFLAPKDIFRRFIALTIDIYRVVWYSNDGFWQPEIIWCVFCTGFHSDSTHSLAIENERENQ